MSLKPITLFGHNGGPNPPKVAILLEELNIPYEVILKEFGNGPNGVKHPDFLKYNPNGRVPAIIDPNNNNVVVWESGAILQYIQKRYDPENKLGGKTAQEEADILSFLFFQVSGHGPSQGQINWFVNYHPEKIPGAIERYVNETKRIYKILDGQLKDRQFFVTDHFTIVDAAFYPWVRSIGYTKHFDFENDFKNDYPNVYAWANRIAARPTVAKAYASFQK